MTSSRAPFELAAESRSGARRGVVTTRHGRFETPAFMPVGTLGTVKALSVADLHEIGAEIILGNAYHLWVRPGADRIAALGGLHRFMAWDRPILTDSGGFQVMSLAHRRRIREDGVHFRSHVDGRALFLSPEESIRIQRALGSDIMMTLDQCPRLPGELGEIREAVDRTTRWAERCLAEQRPDDGALFGIVQGGVDLDERSRSIEALVGLGFEGYALGGLSVGEDAAQTWRVVEACAPQLPRDTARYLMGVGRPEDLVEGVFRGIDMFDCVYPTRNARNGSVFTRTGVLLIKNAANADDPRPIDETCACETCRLHSRAYLRHLYLCKEVLVNRLLTLHNLHFVLELMRDMREAIEEHRLARFREEFWVARGGEPPA